MESLRSFSVFVSVVLKHFMRLDGINQLRSNGYLIFCMCVCRLTLVIRHAKCMNRIILSFVACLAVSHFPHYLESDKIFEKKRYGT